MVQSRKSVPRKSDYAVYTTFQSHEPEFDYLKSLEIEEKINKIRWLKRKNAAQFLLSTNDKTIKLWKVSERDKQLDGCSNFIGGSDCENDSSIRTAIRSTSCLRIPQVKPSDVVVEASPRKVYANAHTYHVNSISVNSDQETFLSADDLRINVWHQDITDESFSELFSCSFTSP
jgi:serine/threonine-protein phosphatase 2A regulatory subunit B